MNNNFELTIAIKGLEVTSNGCTCEDIQFTSKGNFGNEYVAVLGEALNHMLTKIPDAINPCSIEKENFCEVDKVSPATPEPKKLNQRWDLPAIWSVMMSQKPEGFKKTGVGHYTYECGSIKEKNRIRVVIEFKQDSIDCDITVQDSTAFCHLYEDTEYSSISGINAALIGELIEALPDDIKEYVSNYLKKIQTK